MKNVILTLIIWIICFVSITAGAALTYTWYKTLGPEILISFDDASGLVPTQSKIIYRGVEMGIITSIDIDDKDKKVNVYARMNSEATNLLGKDTKFWVVRPELSMYKVSNLSAIATGNYIAMTPSSGELQTQFVGIDEPRLDARYGTGLRVTVRANKLDGIAQDSPVLYRGLQVGEIGDIVLSKDKSAVLITVYVYKEYRDVVRKNSYFGNSSGVHASFSIFGKSNLGMDSLRTVLAGGVTIYTPDLSAPKAKNGDVFKLLTKEQIEAREEDC